MSELLDGGGVVVALLLALLASALLWYGVIVGLANAVAVGAQSGGASISATPAAGTGEVTEYEGNPERPGWTTLLVMVVAGFQPIPTLVSLVLLYTPVTLLLVTLFDRVGSFRVALRRDFAGLLVCTLSAFTVAFLPVGLLGLLLSVPATVKLLLLVIAACGFATLMVVALQTACAAERGPALATVALSWLAFGLQGFSLLPFFLLASPCIAFLAYTTIHGQALDVLGGLGARRSFKRHLEASTLNPYDADAHYQLGLILLQRRQLREAARRFARAVEIDPGELDSQLQLGRIARHDGRWHDSIRHLEAVLSRDPQHASFEAWREAGAVYVSTGAFEHARTVLERFVEHRPYDPEGLHRLAMTHKGLGDIGTARSLWHRCVEAARTTPDHRQREVRPWRREAQRELRRL